jgi:DNA helicase-4
VDEFQDFSFHFNGLLQAILEQNPTLSVFCVGDDWQAINSFAGSNLTYYHNFVDLVPDAKRLSLSTNYRSDANVVEFGNLIMLGTGSPALAKKPGVNVPELCFLDSFVATPSEQEKHGFDEITPATLRIIQSQLVSDRDVVILSRTNYVPYSLDKNLSEVKGNGLDKYLTHIRSSFDKELANRITISTAHKYKGREKQCVIILDAKDRRYPLIHPDWVFSRILGSDLLEMVEEERRLFYVAATRAIDKLFIISERESLTPFIDSKPNWQRLCKVLDWQSLRGPDEKTSSIVVRISSVRFVKAPGTYAIRGKLNSSGYRFISGETKYWQKAYLPEIFSLSKLKLESWAIPRDDLDVDGIQVSVNLAPNGEIGRYRIENGSWICEFEDGSNLKP